MVAFDYVFHKARGHNGADERVGQDVQVQR